ncbi:hypothetical protein SDC9_191575 [bioreactor metagenome]|uniref:Uncharacterized protein n=1 Tax=bioreactor metagenome TaxID=1076179 RepID=A0A645I6J1_9ZZZZ
MRNFDITAITTVPASLLYITGSGSVNGVTVVCRNINTGVIIATVAERIVTITIARGNLAAVRRPIIRRNALLFKLFQHITQILIFVGNTFLNEFILLTKDIHIAETNFAWATLTLQIGFMRSTVNTATGRTSAILIQSSAYFCFQRSNFRQILLNFFVFSQ